MTWSQLSPPPPFQCWLRDISFNQSLKSKCIQCSVYSATTGSPVQMCRISNWLISRIQTGSNNNLSANQFPRWSDAHSPRRKVLTHLKFDAHSQIHELETYHTFPMHQNFFLFLYLTNRMTQKKCKPKSDPFEPLWQSAMQKCFDQTLISHQSHASPSLDLGILFSILPLVHLEPLRECNNIWQKQKNGFNNLKTQLENNIQTHRYFVVSLSTKLSSLERHPLKTKIPPMISLKEIDSPRSTKQANTKMRKNGKSDEHVRSCG